MTQTWKYELGQCLQHVTTDGPLWGGQALYFVTALAIGFEGPLYFCHVMDSAGHERMRTFFMEQELVPYVKRKEIEK